MQARAIAGVEMHVFIFQPQPLGRLNMLMIGKEKNIAAANETEREHNNDQQTPHQK
jgi:hypothetical protein